LRALTFRSSAFTALRALLLRFLLRKAGAT
jgi:hypothetical protein